MRKKCKYLKLKTIWKEFLWEKHIEEKYLTVLYEALQETNTLETDIDINTFPQLP